MKICNECMQIVAASTEACPDCKSANFTLLSNDGSVRKEQVASLKRNKPLRSQRPQKIKRQRYRRGINWSRLKKWQPLNFFLATSFVVTVALNTTVWGGSGNPLDARNYFKGDLKAVGLTPLTDGFRYEAGDYLFVLVQEEESGQICYAETACSASVFVGNLGDRPINFPEAQMCLKTAERHLASRAPAYDPNNGFFSYIINPGPVGNDWSVLFGGQNLNGLWFIQEGEVLEEFYYGTCGEPGGAWFRFKLDAVQVPLYPSDS